METDWKMSVWSRMLENPPAEATLGMLLRVQSFIHFSVRHVTQSSESQNWIRQHYYCVIRFRFFLPGSETSLPLELSPAIFGPCGVPVLTGRCARVLPVTVRQDASQTVVSLRQCWILSSRCEEDWVTSLLRDCLLTKARRRRHAVKLFLAPLISTAT